jgi:hypothetical protein
MVDTKSTKRKSLAKEQVRAHLKKNWKKEGNCTVCDANAWIVVDEEYCLPALYEAKNFPVSIVVCEICGAMTFISSETIKRDILK